MPGLLNTLWYFLIGLLWIGYFFLEGFDFGVGILLPFLGRNDGDRRLLIGTIEPIWDGNEVWLIVAGGATFAAFPGWYATLFSGFYPLLLLILAALICRGVAFEFRGQRRSLGWRRWWDRAIFIGSLLPPVLWGIVFAGTLQGVPIGPLGDFTGGLSDLLQPYALFGGLAFLLLFTLHGALFLALKTEAMMAERARQVAERLWPYATLAVLVFLAWTYQNAVSSGYRGLVPDAVPITALSATIAIGWLVRERMVGFGFVATGVAIILVTATVFLNLYPRVLVSSINPAYSLTTANAASSPYTLRVMTIVAVFGLPLVLAYQGWTYWVFRSRISREDLAAGY